MMNKIQIKRFDHLITMRHGTAASFNFEPISDGYHTYFADNRTGDLCGAS